MKKHFLSTVLFLSRLPVFLNAQTPVISAVTPLSQTVKQYAKELGGRDLLVEN